MRALGKYILVIPVEQKAEVSASGLSLTAVDSAKNRYQEAKVFLVGEDVSTVVTDSTVVFDSGAGHNVKIDNTFYRVILERDICIVL